MKFTLIGGGGFVGRHLAARLESDGYLTVIPSRDWEPQGEQLGHVVYCAGLTADFRTRHHDAVEAHVCKLSRMLEHGRYDSFLYLSSTRVYAGAAFTDEEAPLTVNPLNPDDLYALTKLTGEARCLAVDNPRVRVVRLSNVYGYGDTSDNFLNVLIRQAASDRQIILKTALDSAKDYVDIDAATDALKHIALHGTHRIYNVASGINTTHKAIVGDLMRLTGAAVIVEKDGPLVQFPLIDNRRIRAEFDFHPAAMRDGLERLVKGCDNDKN